MALRYQAAVGRELRKYGLRYDDLLDEDGDMVRLLAARDGLLCTSSG